MRILVVADLHYSLKQFDWVTSVAGGYDLVVVAGDLLDLAGHADLDTQIVVVLKYLDRIRSQAPLIVSSGNHDGDAKNAEDEYIAGWLQRARRENLHVDGDSLMLSEDLFTVCPWWDGPVTREAMRAFIDAEREKPRKRWFWLHHAPPDQSPVSWTGKKHYGDAHLNEIIATHRPHFIFSGHVHNSPFQKEGSWIDRIAETWVFNPGHETSALPSYIVVDLEAMRATWVSSMGTEVVDLTAPLAARSM
ncbi:MAG: metallophosphoesterase family protein [Candidatus Hydrogenedentes bacterium]|nr:metallophosphoesterase family protein [Candidatus Hydrogenedentota bacterium]